MATRWDGVTTSSGALHSYDKDADDFARKVIQEVGPVGVVYAKVVDGIRDKLPKDFDELKDKNDAGLKASLCIILFIILIMSCALFIAGWTLLAFLSVYTGGIMLENDFNMTVDESVSLPLSAELAAVAASMISGTMLLAYCVVSLVLCCCVDINPISGRFNSQDEDFNKQASDFKSCCLCCGVFFLQALLAVAASVIMYVLAKYAESDVNNAYVAFGIIIGMSFAKEFCTSCCNNERKSNKTDSEYDEKPVLEIEASPVTTVENESENEEDKCSLLKFILWIGWNVLTAFVVYKGLVNTGRMADVEGMLQVSCIFGVFNQMYLVPFLPVLFPDAYI